MIVSTEEMMMFEVQHYTLCDGWVNCWMEMDENGIEHPETFETKEAAQAEIDEVIKATIEDFDGKYAHSPEEYRIVEVTA